MSSALIQRVQQPMSEGLARSKKLFVSFKKAAWIASTTSLILLIPLIIEMDREQQILELEKEQLNVLTGAGGGAPAK